ncbi:adenosylcobinamide-phosphate synthase CbiB [Paucibacter sp. APW11]|uniref:Cobalamin biosynthesis protein CobD n=1 Tax=Roseateles aquae TaxID=3077235 RepID=A0ABU3PDJ6_9BURK|nr:adenosylcobinamide-phosphate synthase CbiB [Paucibacter sp. APW11]MDT9000193.1 adenosylcobinamide-phosphate synthase CbiB [Paucibacter sp. APW11]
MALPWLLPLAMLIALLVDRLFGEPPSWAHPVVAMGRYLKAMSVPLLRLRHGSEALGLGALLWFVGATLSFAVALLLEQAMWRWLQPWRGGMWWLAGALWLGLCLKPLLAWRMLRDEVAAVEIALQRSLEEGRTQLARLVSRDTRQLSAAEVREAAISTLAENLNDSVVAPLFWFMLLGLPGAAVYRFANTADAMWGYRGRWEWAGKCAAFADDALSWAPARLTAWSIQGLQGSGRLRQEAARTPSPNGGWPMGAMALRLGVRLGKPGVYTLNEAGRAPESQDLDAALRLAGRALLAAVLPLVLLAGLLRGGLA